MNQDVAQARAAQTAVSNGRVCQSGARRVQLKRDMASMSYEQQVAAVKPDAPLPALPVQQKAVQMAPDNPPPKPANDGEYKALSGYTEFEGNVTAYGLPATLALQCWKLAMDQLYANTAEYKRLALGSDPTAVLVWVDASPQRAGYGKMAEELIKNKKFDTDKEYALWSGKPSQEYAQAPGGCEVLESTHLGKLFDDVRIVFNNWDVQQGLWRTISDAYAREIGTIMTGKKIKVFQRKQGAIFQQVESVALEEVGQKTGIPPQYEFHPLTCPGVFGGEKSYDGEASNSPWREKLKEAADGDERKAKAGAEAEGLRLFDYSDVVPKGDLVDKGPIGDEGSSAGIINAHNARIMAKCRIVETKLKDAAAAARSGR